MTSAANTIVGLLRSEALRNPDAVAILAPGRSRLTYGALGQRIDGAIDALAAAGFGRGHRVALALPNGPEMAVALLAVMGCAECAPLNPTLDEASYLTTLRSLRVEALIAPEGLDTPAVLAARALTLPIIRLAFKVSDAAGTFTLTTDSLRPAVVVAPPEPGEVALVLQTSGTTARPKIVPFTHRNLAASALARVHLVRHTSSDRCLCVAPLFSGMAIRRCLFPMIVTGGSVVCPPLFDANLFFTWLDAFEPTFYVAVPAIHRAVLDEVDRGGGARRSTLRFIGSESVTLPVAVENGLEKVFGVPVVQGYGLTETGLIAQTPLEPDHRRAGSVGKPIDGEIAILEDERPRISTGQVGEIVVRSAAVFDGYEGDLDANRESFRDGWFRTGDLGFLDQDGYLFLVGRIKELINRGGTKVSPTAVDAALLGHPAVGDVATFPVAHPTLGEDVVSAVVLRERAQATPQELRDFAFEHLPDFSVPSRVVTVAELPRTSRGKLKRGELAKVLESQLRVAFCPPRDGNEEQVALYFAEVLGRDRVGAFDDFFELGGDSLRGQQLVTRVNLDLGTDLRAVTLFRRPTVAEFAAELALAGGRSQTFLAAVPLVGHPRQVSTLLHKSTSKSPSPRSNDRPSANTPVTSSTQSTIACRIWRGITRATVGFYSRRRRRLS